MDIATQQFALKHRSDDLHRLLLQQSAYPGIDIPAAVTQIEGWTIARNKIPSWATNDAILYPPRLAMEQCSSELTARYKASIVSGIRMTDLTGGFGVDSSFMSERFNDVTYVERNEQLFAISSANFESLGLTNIHPVCGDGRNALSTLPHQNWIYLDPARRDTAGHKTVALADCEPDVSMMEEELLAHANNILVKCSPMLDISLACTQLRHVQEVHVVAVKGECKELLLVLNNADIKPSEVPITCIDLPEGKPFTFTREEEDTCGCPFQQPGRYIYEPNAALLKAGCFRLPATRFGLQKLHPNTHLYTSDVLYTDFPGRIFEVIHTCGFSKRELRSALGELQCANITVRNFPQSVDTLRRRLHLAEGGDNYLFATTIGKGEHRLIRCRKVQ